MSFVLEKPNSSNLPFNETNPTQTPNILNATDNTLANKELALDADSSVSGTSKTGKSKSPETYLSIICVIAGSGIIALPISIMKTGISSVALLVTNFIIAWYTGTLIIKCLYYDSPRRLESLPQIGYEAFGIFGRTVVQFAHYGIVLGGACVYILTAGHNISETMKQIFSYQIEEKYYILGSGIFVMIVYCCAKTIKEAAWMSVLGAVSTLVIVVVAIIASTKEITHISSVGSKLPIEWTKFDLWNLPSTLATASFAYGGAVVFPHIESSMRQKKNWGKLSFFALLSVSVMYVIVSFFGNAAYGERLKKHEYIYDIFQRSEANVSRLFMTLHVLLAAPVYMCSFGIETENHFKITVENLGQKKELLIRIILRSGEVAILTFIAMACPNFGSIVSLIGAMANGLIIFIVPVVCYYKLYGVQSTAVHKHILHAIILLIGVICMVFGTILALKNMIKPGKPEITH